MRYKLHRDSRISDLPPIPPATDNDVFTVYSQQCIKNHSLEAFGVDRKQSSARKSRLKFYYYFSLKNFRNKKLTVLNIDKIQLQTIKTSG
jgi:hypothetical protein